MSEGSEITRLQKRVEQLSAENAALREDGFRGSADANLWTRDKRLQQIAADLGIAAPLPPDFTPNPAAR